MSPTDSGQPRRSSLSAQVRGESITCRAGHALRGPARIRLPPKVFPSLLPLRKRPGVPSAGCPFTRCPPSRAPRRRSASPGPGHAMRTGAVRSRCPVSPVHARSRTDLRPGNLPAAVRPAAGTARGNEEKAGEKPARIVEAGRPFGLPGAKRIPTGLLPLGQKREALDRCPKGRPKSGPGSLPEEIPVSCLKTQMKERRSRPSGDLEIVDQRLSQGEETRRLSVALAGAELPSREPVEGREAREARGSTRITRHEGGSCEGPGEQQQYARPQLPVPAKGPAPRRLKTLPEKIGASPAGRARCRREHQERAQIKSRDRRCGHDRCRGARGPGPRARPALSRAPPRDRQDRERARHSARPAPPARRAG